MTYLLPFKDFLIAGLGLAGNFSDFVPLAVSPARISVSEPDLAPA